MIEVMTQADVLTRDELYWNWLAWVTTNLRDDPKYAAIAANAAADAVLRGDGINAAAAAATNAWIEAAQGDKPFWRLTFWGLLLTDFPFWALVVMLITLPLYRVAPVVTLFVFLIPLALAAVGWRSYLFFRLSRRGIVAPGSLFKVTVKDSDGDVYRATYEFKFHGQRCISRLSRTSPPEGVLILFDPKHPKFAMLMPDLLNPGA
jgi:hypothetical protein